MMPKTPPNTRNCETWSTSLVTRETSAPRCSVFWVSSGRSWTCRKALIRSVARPRSEAVNSRAVMKYDQPPGRPDQGQQQRPPEALAELGREGEPAPQRLAGGDLVAAVDGGAEPG